MPSCQRSEATLLRLLLLDGPWWREHICLGKRSTPCWRPYGFSRRLRVNGPLLHERLGRFLCNGCLRRQGRPLQRGDVVILWRQLEDNLRTHGRGKAHGGCVINRTTGRKDCSQHLMDAFELTEGLRAAKAVRTQAMPACRGRSKGDHRPSYIAPRRPGHGVADARFRRRSGAAVALSLAHRS